MESEQGALFPVPRHWRDSEQIKEAKRVGAGIGEEVMRFCVLKVGKTFHMEELREWIYAKGYRAPDSAGRILRLLRQTKNLDYEVVSRSDSLYRIKAVHAQHPSNQDGKEAP